nr:MAG TPA: aragonite protein [Caudoviricetes sp.]
MLISQFLFLYYISIFLFCQLFILLFQKNISENKKKCIDMHCAYGNIFTETE